MSVAQNSHLTNKPEALHHSTSAPFYGYFKLHKATWKGQKSKLGFVVTPGN